MDDYYDWLNKTIDDENRPTLFEQEERLDIAPLIFIAFAPRSGSTLLSQLLANSGKFNYISNFVARFWNAPDVGMYLQRDFRFQEQLNFNVEDHTSFYGRTEGAMSPHEFGYFWQRFIPNGESHYYQSPYKPETILRLRQDVQSLRLLSTNKPLFFKNSIAGYNHEFIKHCFPDAKFVVLTRTMSDVVKSILAARVKLLGDSSKWWSLKPKDYIDIVSSGGSSEEIVYKQVESIYRHLMTACHLYPEDTTVIDYADVLADSDGCVDQIYRFSLGLI